MALLDAADRANRVDVSRDLEALEKDGYVILHDLISKDEIAAIKEANERFAYHKGANPFEGHLTTRVYNVLPKTRATDCLLLHPRVLALLDATLMKNYLLSNAQIINILPGETEQKLHFDGGFYYMPRGTKKNVHAAFIAAIDDFTAENGATNVVPGSHMWVDRRPTREETIPAVMPAGSAIFFYGTTWHSGGANKTDKPRMAFTGQYCDPYLRQIENFSLEVPPMIVRELPEKLQELIGYSLHGTFMGFVDRHHPKKVLQS
jgi:ectoine hydroxylase-related dioxygenase (phytanoyl-CoA dioxygenase family)